MKNRYEKLQTIQTPAFILDKSRLEKNLDNMICSFEKHWKNIIIGYSYKTNSLPWLLKYMQSKGIYAEVVSPDEYALAKEIGYEDDKIILNGPYKSQESIKSVLLNGGILNIDAIEEAKYVVELSKEFNNLKVGVRINFDLEKYAPSETLMGKESGRFGFNIENGSFEDVLQLLKNNGVDIVGLHSHVSTKTKSLNVFRESAKMISKLIKKYNLNLDYIDIGGGFFGDKPTNAPTYEEYILAIKNELKEIDDSKTALIFEPGVALAASAFQYICKVFDEKIHKDFNIILTDGSIMQIDAQMNNRKFPYNVISKDKGSTSDLKQIVSGFTCMEKDRFIYIDKNAQKLKKDDYIELLFTGAYTLNFTPLFIQFLPNVYVYENDKYYLVRKKWGAKEYMINNSTELELK